MAKKQPDNLVKITFVRDTLPHESDEKFLEGKTYKLAPGSAARWVKRAAAVYVTDATTETPAPEAPEKEDTSNG